MSELHDDEIKKFVAGHLEAIDTAGSTDAVNVEGFPIFVITVIGAKTGKPRRVPLGKVEKDGAYLAVASKAGSDHDPAWANNLRKNPEVSVQDGSQTFKGIAKELTGSEREKWWKIAVEQGPIYAQYQKNTSRQIPIFLIDINK